MHFHRIFYGKQIRLGENAKQGLQAGLVCRHDLICHGLAPLSAQNNQGFTRVLTFGVAGQRHDDNASEVAVCGVIADDDSGACFSNPVADSWIEFNPPHLTAKHLPYPQ